MISFVDTHCHGLPGVDDGVQNEESALLLLKHAVESQIRLVFMTPHVIKDGKFYPSKALLDKKMKDLRALIQTHQLPIEVRLGCEIMILHDTIDQIHTKAYWGYEDTDYVLIEFLNPINNALVLDVLYELKRQGKKALIAHPERYFMVPEDAVTHVSKWRKAGAEIQVNRTSLLAPHKASVRQTALALIDANLVSVIASDAHHAPGRRECKLKDIHEKLTHWFGSETADCLVSVNPGLLADNKPLRQTTLSQSLFSKTLRKLKTKLFK